MQRLAEQWHILGAGALGSLISARLIRANKNVTMILKDSSWEKMGSPPTATVHVTELFKSKHHWHVEASLEPVRAKEPIRRLLVATKCGDVCCALHGVVDRLTSDAIVVLLCNGMGVHDELISTERLAGASYLLASTTHGAFTTARFHCVHAGFGRMWVGIPNGSTHSINDVRSAVASLDQTGLGITMEDRVEHVLWEKLAVNASINGVTALLDCCNGSVIENRHGLSLIERLCREVGQVMKAAKMDVSEDLVSKVMQVLEQNAGNSSSMRQDMLAGRATEIDYINGFVVQRGMVLGVPTPTNRAIYDLIKLKEAVRH